MRNRNEERGASPVGFDLSEDLFAKAARGEELALRQLSALEAPRLAEMQRVGFATYGDLGLGVRDATRALARCAEAIVRVEGELPHSALARVVLADAWFAEALLLGRESAWKQFSPIVGAAVRSLHANVHSALGRLIITDLEGSALGAFYMESRIASYRATAPISAWARTVVFNLWRAALARQKDSRTAVAFSQLTAEDGAVEDLAPPSHEPDPAELASREEWDKILARIVPEALSGLDRDERRMLSALPSKQVTQVALARELGVSPFRINRWYKEVRERFLRAVRRGLQLDAHLSELEAERLVAWLASHATGTESPASALGFLQVRATS
jgi:RNA polymerase sigma factor (sigma-70 family)